AVAGGRQGATRGKRAPRMCSWYQIQASGLIGSPTVPSSRSDERSCLRGYSSPHRIIERIAVGAVYRIETWYFSTIAQKRSLSGQSGAPSYIRQVAPAATGPHTLSDCPLP